MTRHFCDICQSESDIYELTFPAKAFDEKGRAYVTKEVCVGCTNYLMSEFRKSYTTLKEDPAKYKIINEYAF